jgi:hypothetical protein
MLQNRITMTEKQVDSSMTIEVLDIEERAAIQDYDYEKARFLAELRQVVHRSNVEDATAHYEQELDKYNTGLAEILARKKAVNEVRYESELSIEKERLERQVSDLEETQRAELEDLEARWREARAHEKERVEKTVVTLLSSSKALAKSHRFDEAISLRDEARTTQKRVRHPNIDKIDADYENQFRETLLKYEQTFRELIDQHEAFKLLLREKQGVADQTAQSEDRVEAAYGTIEVMDTALGDARHPDVTLPVVKHFSQRRRPPPSTGTKKRVSKPRVA